MGGGQLRVRSQPIQLKRPRPSNVNHVIQRMIRWTPVAPWMMVPGSIVALRYLILGRRLPNGIGNIRGQKSSRRLPAVLVSLLWTTRCASETPSVKLPFEQKMLHGFPVGAVVLPGQLSHRGVGGARGPRAQIWPVPRAVREEERPIERARSSVSLPARRVRPAGVHAATLERNELRGGENAYIGEARRFRRIRQRRTPNGCIFRRAQRAPGATPSGGRLLLSPLTVSPVMLYPFRPYRPKPCSGSLRAAPTP